MKRRAPADQARLRDLDETRRLCYMALLARCTERYELAGTLVNALRHHQGIDEDDLEDTITRIINGTASPGDDQWLLAQIGKLTAEHGGKP